MSHLRRDGASTPSQPGLGFDRAPTASPSGGRDPSSEAATASAAASLAAHFDRGLSLRSSGPEGLGGATSAPPPPGFGAAPDQPDGTLRLDMARDWLMQRQGSSARGGGSDGAAASGQGGPGRIGAGSRGGLVGTRISEDQIYQGSSALLRPSELAAFDMGRPLSAPLHEDPVNEGRSTSYVNLAAALGEELAESMEDSLQKQQQQQQQQLKQHQRPPQHLPELALGQERAAAGVRGAHYLPSVAEQTAPAGLSSLQIAAASRTGSNGGGELDNFARQSRHTASRLVGSSAGGMGVDLRYSSATGAAVMPADILASRNRRGSADDGVGTGGGGSGQQQQYFQSPTVLPPKYVSRALPAITPSETSTYESGSSGKNSPHIVHHAHNAKDLVGVTVTEPASGKNTPQLMALMHDHGIGGQPPPHGASPAIVLVDNREGRRYSAPPNSVVDGRQVQSIAGPATSYITTAAPCQYPSATESPSGGTLEEYQQRSREHSPHPSALQIDGSSLDRALTVQAEIELTPFLWGVYGNDGGTTARAPSSSRTPSPVNRTSRGLAILHAAHLFIPDVRSTCEAFGSLMSFRPEFCKSRGVIFVSYHDLRSAQYATVELKASLKRLATPRGASGDRYDDFQVQYCIPLNASAAGDDSTVVVSNLPGSFDEQSLKIDMMAYGAVRSVRFDGLGEHNADSGRSYIVEFYDVQDAKQAVLELENTQPWGPEATASVGVRHPSERRQGQELLSLIGRWRKEESSRVEVGSTVNLAAVSSPSPLPSMEAMNPRTSTAHSSTSPASLHSDSAPTASNIPGATISSTSSSYQRPGLPNVDPSRDAPSQHPHHLQAATQVVVGPDGQYSYVVVNQPHGQIGSTHHPHPHSLHRGHTYVSAHHHPAHPPVQQQIIHGPQGTYVTTVPTQVYHGHHLPPQITPQYHLPPGAVVATPYAHGYPASVPVYTHVHGAPTDSSVSSGSAGGIHHQRHHLGAPAPSRHGTGGTGQRQPHGGNDEDSTQLLLDIEAVESGTDTRTSLMVRNIPNKYTQKMLLDEFAETGHGSDKMDFFYLPIDFKNKCNRGYAFVNFVDYRDIASFHHQYNGKHWKVFNSDKICDISYARIQGKTAMLKRFQNSSLMNQDEDYKPVAFVSSGPRKGEREDFPTSHNHGHSHSHQGSSLAAAASAARSNGTQETHLKY